MTKLIFIVVTILLSVIADYTTDGCIANGLACTLSTGCCSGICNGKCIPCQAVNAICDQELHRCCPGLQCDPSTRTCCRIQGQTTLTSSECCSHQSIANPNGCGQKCLPPCQPVNSMCDFELRR